MRLSMSNIINEQTEPLVILQEECAELIQIISKIYRWGLDSNNNGKLPLSNKEQLIQELGDVLALIRIVCTKNNISTLEIDSAIDNKLKKLKIYSSISL